MKRRLILVLALSVLAVSGASASAAGSRPVTGTWSAKAANSAEVVRFELKKTKTGYRARTTRIVVVGSCSSDAPNAAPSDPAISVDDVSVILRKRGEQLTGLGKVSEANRGGTVDAGVRLTFVSARRAKVAVSLSRQVSRPDENGSVETCKGRIALTARPGS